MIKYPKPTFTFLVICLFICLLLLLFLHSYCCANVQKIVITKEDIKNAKPVSPFQVEFSKKDLKYVEMMEKRHFPRTDPEFSDKERLKNLEYELLGRIWEYTPQNDRIERLGVALPASISSRRNAKRMRNDTIQLRQRDNVGLIDGFLRLISPEKYEYYRQYSDNMFEKYDY